MQKKNLQADVPKAMLLDDFDNIEYKDFVMEYKLSGNNKKKKATKQWEQKKEGT